MMSKTLVPRTVLTVREMLDFLKQIDEKQLDQEIMIRTGPKGSLFNLESIGLVEQDTYGFFGVPVDCLVLTPLRLLPEET